MQSITGTPIPAVKGEIYNLEELIEEQGRILEMISLGKDLHEILKAIVLWVEKESREGLLASILLLDRDGKTLLHGAAPSLPEKYNRAIHGVTIGPMVGSCGTAAFNREQVVVEDIDTDPLWKEFRELAMGHQLRACWSTPLINKKGQVLGTFAMYYSYPKKPSVHDLQVIRLISSTTVLAIEWSRSEEERKLLHNSEMRAYEKISKEREQFYNLLMKAPAMVAVLRGPEHRFELANHIYMKAIGEHREIIGKPVREALPELEGQGLYELLDQVFQMGETVNGNEVLVKLVKDKEKGLEDSYFNFVYQPIMNDIGRPEGVFVHAVDITELLQSKKRTEESEERFRSFVLNSPTPIGIYIGREMRIQTANEAILKAWEKDQTVIGKTFREALPELEGQPYYQLLDDVFTTGIPYQATEDRVDLMRDGKVTPTYWNFNYKALRNADGEIYGVINTGVEVTELVSAKKKLAAAEETLRSAIEVAELGTWSIELGTDYVYYSEPVAAWFGLPHNGVPLTELLDRIHEEDRGQVRESLDDAISKTDIVEVVYRVRNPMNKRERILLSKGKVVTDQNGTAHFMNGVCRDITLQKETEKELTREVEKRTIELLEANAELNSLNDHLKQFVYIASHDLQEPLRKINMFSDMLRKKTSEQLDETSSHYLSRITKAAHRMTSLIRDLLDYSRAEGDVDLFAETDLNQILKNVVDDYELMISQKNAKVEAGSLPVVEAIPLQMNQMFYNLLGNALKFSRPGISPQIQISSRIMDAAETGKFPQLEKGPVYAEIVVKDNGIGFNPRFAEQIFIIFQRLHGKDEYEGTGLGLALCRKIMENHNGLIYAESSENEGARFVIVLPVKRNR